MFGRVFVEMLYVKPDAFNMLILLVFYTCMGAHNQKEEEIERERDNESRAGIRERRAGRREHREEEREHREEIKEIRSELKLIFSKNVAVTNTLC